VAARPWRAELHSGWLVSTVPWALTAGLPRFAGAIGWLLLLGLLGIALPLGELPPVADALLVPVGLVGRDLGRADWPLVLPGVALGLAAMIAACASPGTAQTGCRECAANAPRMRLTRPNG
jgi:hypothetical protein